MPSASAEELKPVKDYNAMDKEMRRASDAERKARAEAYLAKWKASGQTATGSSLYAIAQFQQAAEQYEASAAGFRAVRKDESVKEKVRDYAASAEANLLLFPELRSALGKQKVDAATADLTAYIDTMSGDQRKKSRNKVRGLVASSHERSGRMDTAHEMRMAILAEDPKQVPSLARPIMLGLAESSHAPDGYVALRKKAADALATLRQIQQGVIDANQKKLETALAKLKAKDPDALDADGNVKETDRRAMSREEKAVVTAQRSGAGAAKVLASLDEYERPFALLGKPAAAWTLDRAYGDVESLDALQGQVVVLDVWATWIDHLNFPVMRDLLKAYGDKGLAVVGVTASAQVVYADRYDIDADHASKATGEGLTYAARLASDDAPADGQYILEEGPYREREMEALAVFVKNHELTWPVVLIQEDEPEAKYGLGHWPHLVVLDRKGCIRYLRSGALPRADAESLAKLHEVIEALLAEK